MIYLASNSSRRADLLRQIGLSFEQLPVEIDESQYAGESAAEYVMRMALAKARAGCELVPENNHSNVVLGADTIISLDGLIIGKSNDCAECRSTLRLLSGRQHQVLSAVTLIQRNDVLQKLSINRVSFRPVDESEVSSYCASEEPVDKAGSYAIQGKAAIFINHLEGSYSSVMGLPLFETAELLKRVNLSVLKTCQ